MIRVVTIRNFKAFRAISLNFGKLTLLTGANSSGKSSVLQALLIADDSATASPWVQLNDRMGLALGEAQDVLSRHAAERHIELAVTADGVTDTYKLGIPAEERALVLERLEPDSAPKQRRWRIGSYLGAERLGPRDVSGVAAAGGDEVDVGTRGEFTAYALARFGAKASDAASATSFHEREQPIADPWCSS